jgi:transglutaminase-like putative cysteine protease
MTDASDDAPANIASGDIGAPAMQSTLNVLHITTYRYSRAVEHAQQRAVVTPPGLPWQTVVAHSTEIDPGATHQHVRTDDFGNSVLHFMLDVPHDVMRLACASTVVLTPRWQALDPEASTPWEVAAQALRFHASQPYCPEAEFVFGSPNISLHPDLRDYALPSFGAGMPVIAGAIDLMHRIHADFIYHSEATEVDTPALHAFALRSGVCQDFAQVMIGCLRSLGLAARYVSGYLCTEPPPGEPRLLGADASHAWISVFCPDTGWVDLDPTNDMLADTRHVTLAVGRDYSDVPLLHGVIVGGGAHTIEVEVSVVPAD